MAAKRTAVPKNDATDSINWGRRRWEELYGSSGAMSMETVSSLVRVREILVEFADVTLAAVELSFFEYDVMNVIDMIGGGAMPLGRIGENARRYFTHQTSVTNLVNRLVDRGYVELRKDERDGRVTRAAITPLGRRRLKHGHQLLAAQQFGLEGMDERDMEKLNGLLHKIRVLHDDVKPHGYAVDERS